MPVLSADKGSVSTHSLPNDSSGTPPPAEALRGEARYVPYIPGHVIPQDRSAVLKLEDGSVPLTPVMHAP
ncbi:unnamed protein product [Phytomonas sp. Hart1]|nr:unnamed protein product [Phytomonas sp. Hart1]|eukprot:CCW70043.1 unnamed protein product [Phytomonas sp. isolate Hart1]